MLSTTNKAIKRWVLPTGIYELIRDAYKGAQNRHMRPLVSKNIQFKNKHKGQRVFILATGPSINSQNLQSLQNEICIGVSQFYLHEQINTIKPDYHVLAPSHAPFDFELYKTYFDGFEKHYADIDVAYFLGYRPYEYSVMNFLKGHPQYQSENLNFIDYSSPLQLSSLNYKNKNSWDISTQNSFGPRTVIYTAIQVAFYMGFSEIYLLGCDHDYLKNINRVADHHFYRDDQGGIDQKTALSKFTLERWFEEYYYRWFQYRLMRDYLSSMNCEIYDATPNGMLDMFPKVDLTQLLLE